MEDMKKPWVYERKDVNGWWVGWYEGGRRKAKSFPTKTLADHFKQVKYAQLNSDVFTGLVNVEWPQMVTEYEQSKRVAGFRDTSIYEAALTLRHFARLVGPLSSKQITQPAVDRFILERGKEVKRFTLNKDISNLRAFIHWCVECRYLGPGLKVKKRKVEQISVRALNAEEVKNLLISAAAESPVHRMRVLLAVSTGLRRGDIETLRISDIRFDRRVISTRSRKTGKTMERPIPEKVMPELASYVAALPRGQEKLFAGDTHTSKKWNRIRERAELPGLKFHDLRKTFASMLAQGGVSTAVTQRLLEHSSPQLTQEIYTNVDPVLRASVNKLPVADWLN
jgi:integrase